MCHILQGAHIFFKYRKPCSIILHGEGHFLIQSRMIKVSPQCSDSKWLVGQFGYSDQNSFRKARRMDKKQLWGSVLYSCSMQLGPGNVPQMLMSMWLTKEKRGVTSSHMACPLFFLQCPNRINSPNHTHTLTLSPWPPPSLSLKVTYNLQAGKCILRLSTVKREVGVDGEI